MTLAQIPRAALVLGLASLAPFVWSAATMMSGTLASWSATTLGPRFAGPYIGLGYGTIYLAFMSGALWGFATRVRGTQAAICYVLAAIPALWAFLMVGGGPVSASMYLIFGFLGLLVLDIAFWRWGLTPQWWMSFHVLLTGILVPCLAVALI